MPDAKTGEGSESGLDPAHMTRYPAKISTLYLGFFALTFRLRKVLLLSLLVLVRLRKVTKDHKMLPDLEEAQPCSHGYSARQTYVSRLEFLTKRLDESGYITFTHLATLLPLQNTSCGWVGASGHRVYHREGG